MSKKEGINITKKYSEIKNGETKRLNSELEKLIEQRQRLSVLLNDISDEQHRQSTEELIDELDADIEAYRAHISMYTLLVKELKK